MARVALGRPLYNPVEIRDGTTSYVPCLFFFRFRADIAPPSGRYISPCFRDHRGLGKALVPRTRIPFLRAALRDRVCPTKGAERMGYG